MVAASLWWQQGFCHPPALAAGLEDSMGYRKDFYVDPASRLHLGKLDTAGCGHETAESANAKTDHFRRRLAELQALLYAGKQRSVLVVLQAMDTGGKDGTVSHVFTGLNPQGTSLTSFKQPTPTELAHDFLWRVHPHVPAHGEIAVFNRSHYEDVLVTRVHKLIGRDTWAARCGRIRAFEESLAGSGTAILKFFLHISKEEQLARFGQRLADPARNWKISEADYAERDLWDDYIRTYEAVLEATSTPAAPWYVIPSDHKWFRNLAVSSIIANTMDGLGLSFPEPSVDLAAIRRKYHAAGAAAETVRTVRTHAHADADAG
jgi:PPK2 family polyphosphate:nucleotide phosphotransferase